MTHLSVSGGERFGHGTGASEHHVLRHHHVRRERLQGATANFEGKSRLNIFPVSLLLDLPPYIASHLSFSLSFPLLAHPPSTSIRNDRIARIYACKADGSKRAVAVCGIQPVARSARSSFIGRNSPPLKCKVRFRELNAAKAYRLARCRAHRGLNSHPRGINAYIYIYIYTDCTNERFQLYTFDDDRKTRFAYLSVPREEKEV